MEYLVNFYEYRDLDEYSAKGIKEIVIHKQRFEDIRDLCIELNVPPPKRFELLISEKNTKNEYVSFFGKTKTEEIKTYNLTMQVSFEIKEERDKFEIMCIMKSYYKGLHVERI